MDRGGPESVAGLLAPFDGLFERLEQVVTLDRAVRYCFALSDMPAPSGSARFTRAKALVSLLERDGLLSGLTAEMNYLGTGNLTLATGMRPAKPVWLLAHLDQCSYLVDRREGSRYRLIPNCYHMIRAGYVPARALDLGADGEPTLLAEGTLSTESDGRDVFFEAQSPTEQICRGARIIIAPGTGRLSDGGITGSLDDAFGCAALALAAASVAPYAADVLFVFTDEEEGPVSAGNLSFARGSSRLVHRVPPDQLPQLAIVVDSHEAEDMADGPGPSRIRPGGGACFGEAASHGRGGITQPRLYAFQRTLGAFLETRGVALRENADGYFSRSDCVPLMLATPNVGLLGYLLSHRHFDGQPRAHPADLIHLARSLAVYALVAQSADWRAAHLGSR